MGLCGELLSELVEPRVRSVLAVLLMLRHLHCNGLNYELNRLNATSASSGKVHKEMQERVPEQIAPPTLQRSLGDPMRSLP